MQTSNERAPLFYDGTDPLIRMDGSGNLTAVNTFGAAGLVSRHTSTGSTFYTFDTQGSTVERLDGSPNVLSTDVFDSFGKLLSGTASDPWGYEAQGGYFTDTETGLISLSFRYYDPAAGRFLNRDPIGFDGGINLYGYVANGPLTASDPIGTMYEDPTHLGGVVSGTTGTLLKRQRPGPAKWRRAWEGATWAGLASLGRAGVVTEAPGQDSVGAGGTMVAARAAKTGVGAAGAKGRLLCPKPVGPAAPTCLSTSAPATGRWSSTSTLTTWQPRSSSGDDGRRGLTSRRPAAS